jgi:transcription termination factor Rho
MHLSELKAKHVAELLDIANTMEIDGANRMRKHDLIFALLKSQAKKGESIFGEGVLEVLPDGFGFLRSPDTSYLAGTDDIYISPSQIPPLQPAHRRHDRRRDPHAEGWRALLRAGQGRQGQLRGAGKRQVQDPVREPDAALPRRADGTRARHQGRGEHHRPRHRHHRADRQGQRGLLVSSPKSGKTVMLQHIAHAITANHPDVMLIVLLIDERPEEGDGNAALGARRSRVVDVRRAGHAPRAGRGNGDREGEAPGRAQEDVVILLDSITRLARAYNTVVPASGKVLTGGVDANALQRPKRFFGAARNIEEGGSLTIIATALIDTGSRMDDVIYEEFKGTGNMEIHLDRRSAEKRIYPAINVNRSGTRKEELLLKPDILQKVWVLRKLLYPMDELEAMEFLIDKVKQTKNNAEFFDSMRRG